MTASLHRNITAENQASAVGSVNTMNAYVAESVIRQSADVDSMKKSCNVSSDRTLA